jgi:hypothetical protein
MKFKPYPKYNNSYPIPPPPMPQQTVLENDPSLPAEFKCGHCGLQNKNLIELDDHIMVVHENAFGGGIIPHNYNCAHCGENFDNEDSYYDHIDDAHGGEESVSKEEQIKEDIKGDISGNRIMELFSDTDEEDETISKPEKDNKETKVDDNKISNAAVEAAEIDNTKADILPPLVYPKLIKKKVPKQEYDTPDKIPVSKLGKYVCPQCNNRYSSQNYLGEHFTLSHSSYGDQLKLDEKKLYTSFPGYFVLKLIGMIKLFDIEELKDQLLNDCPICCYEYTLDEDIRKLHEREIVIAMKESETTKEIDIKKELSTEFKQKELKESKPAKMKWFISNTNTKKVKQSVIDREKKEDEDREILMKYRKDKSLAAEPVQVTCCKKVMCKTCFENHLKHTNNIQCPFCKFDHNKYDQDYIRYTEISKFNRKAWIEWWSNHLDILERNLFSK